MVHEAKSQGGTTVAQGTEVPLLYGAIAALRYKGRTHTNGCKCLTSHRQCDQPVSFQALRFQMKRALHDTNLRQWAELMQASVPYRPYNILPACVLVSGGVQVGCLDLWLHMPWPCCAAPCSNWA